MMSTDLSLHELEGSFAEDNLLCAEDWENIGSAALNSVYADYHPGIFDSQVSCSDGTASSPDSNSLDGSDAWLSDINIQGAALIKEEPMSPMKPFEYEMQLGIQTPDIEIPFYQKLEDKNGLKKIEIHTNIKTQSKSEPNRIPTALSSSSLSSSSSSSPPPLDVSMQSLKLPLNTSPNKITMEQSRPLKTMTATSPKVSLITIPSGRLLGLPGVKGGAPVVKIENGKLVFSGNLASIPNPATNKPAGNINESGNENKIIAQQPSQIQAPSVCNTSDTAAQVTACTTSDTDIKLWKRQQRMIKNRESASLSRRKKKAYLLSLEEKINELFSVNSQLSLENDSLKKRVQFLESENIQLKQSSTNGSSAKKVTSVLMVVAFLAFNLSKNWSEPTFSSAGSIPIYTSHRSRSLLNYDENKLESSDLGYRNIAFDGKDAYTRKTEGLKDRIEKYRLHHLGLDKLQRSTEQHVEYISKIQKKSQELEISDCLTDFNKTEANRLNEALELLLERSAKAKLKIKRKLAKKKSRIKGKRNIDVPVVQQSVENLNCTGDNITEGNYTKLPVNKTTKHNRPIRNQIQLFPNFIRSLGALQKSIQRQPDTFYIISLKTDHLFLPATRLNDTARPKVSFVLPTSFSNDSSIPQKRDKFSLMQIDCQVMDTKLLSLAKGDVPPFLFDHSNGMR